MGTATGVGVVRAAKVCPSQPSKRSPVVPRKAASIFGENSPGEAFPRFFPDLCPRFASHICQMCPDLYLHLDEAEPEGPQPMYELVDGYENQDGRRTFEVSISS